MASTSLVLSGCGSKTTTTPISPSITSFTAAQPSIAKGASTTLNWQVSGSTPLTLSLDNGIGNVSGSSYVVSPAATTTYTLTATNSAGQVSKNLTVSVTGTGGTNQAPTLNNTIANKNVSQGAAAQTVDLKTIFTDAEDGTNLSYSVSSSNLSITSASITGSTLTLNFGSAGTAQITVTAKDSGNLSVNTSFSVTVASGGTPPTNQAPVVTGPIAGKNVSQGAAAQSVDLKTVFNDAEDGTNLTFSASSSNTGVAGASVSGSSLNLSFGSVGTAQVTVTAKDSSNLSVSTSFSVVVASGGGGASCISGNFMNVQPYAGNASLPNPTLAVTCTATKASVATNAIPNHQTGAFPNPGNPNSISAQNRNYPLTLSPAKAASITLLSLGTMGLAINGIALEPMAAEFYNNDKTSGWQYEALATTPSAKKLGIDTSNAHVQPNGNYHYHGLPNGLVTLLNRGSNLSIIGYIGDGFPIYAVYGYNTASDASSGTKELKSSYRLKSGTRPSGPGGSYDGTFVQDYEYVAGLGDLDECNGRFGVTPEYPGGIYHYYITKEWPFIPRCFSGTPDNFYVAAPK
jgi:hypothetical protein